MKTMTFTFKPSVFLRKTQFSVYVNMFWLVSLKSVGSLSLVAHKKTWISFLVCQCCYRNTSTKVPVLYKLAWLACMWLHNKNNKHTAIIMTVIPVGSSDKVFLFAWRYKCNFLLEHYVFNIKCRWWIMSRLKKLTRCCYMLSINQVPCFCSPWQTLYFSQFLCSFRVIVFLLQWYYSNTPWCLAWVSEIYLRYGSIIPSCQY
jgi:hypothetical protein